ncbi:MAG: bifunctional 5,10-methylenetetrahydrofolate dehydrogenase/5,10-methenyltetrahydrofolate cyclohydrolase [Myxococcota bacterium]
MAQIVDGKKLAEELREEVRVQASGLGGVPCLATVLVGEDPASQVYVRNKHRGCKAVGIESIQLELPADTSEGRLLEEVTRLNEDSGVHGVLVQLPLPNGIDPYRIAASIDPLKDVDGLHPFNVGRLVQGRPGLYPGTPLGILEILDRYKVPIEGKRAIVIGRSEIVGKPTALLLLHRHATVTLCHSRTQDLPDETARADIVIAAVGRPRMVRGDWIKPGATVIDVGVNRVDGKLVGDVDFAGALETAGLLTPVPGGVGRLTIAMVLRNTVRAFELQHADSNV